MTIVLSGEYMVGDLRKDTNMPSSVNDLQNYDAIVTFAVAAEQSRWERFASYLLVNSILLLAWATIYVTCTSMLTVIVLIILCIPGIVLGFVWSFLGKRTSDYVDKMHDEGLNLENSIPQLYSKPFAAIEQIREDVRNKMKKHKMAFTSSKTIVTWVPVIFSFIYIGLAVCSIIKN
jgi:hypothetical protein